MPSVRLVAAAALLGLSAVAADAHAVDAVVPLGATHAGEVPPGGGEGVVGVLVPAGAAKGSITVKAAKGSSLVPQVSVVLPDGSVRTAPDFLAEGAKVKSTPKAVSIKKMATIGSTGLYRILVTGADDSLGDPTSGGFTAVWKAKPSKGFKTPVTALANQADKDNWILNAPENGFLSVKLKPGTITPFVPSLQILTPSGDAVNYDAFVKFGKDSSISLRNLPLPFFGDYTLRVGGTSGFGEYTLQAKVKGKKPKPVAGAPVADAGGTLILEQGTQGSLSAAGSVGADSFQWCQVSGPPLSIVTRTSKAPVLVAPLVRGTYAWQVVASNGAGSSLPAVAILEVDRRPVASAGPGRSVAVGTPVTLDGSGSLDLDPADVLRFEWSQASGPAADLDDPWAAQPSFTPAAAGTYVFRLVVSDGTASSAPDTVVVVAGGASAMADAGRPVLVRLQDSVFLSGLRSRSASGGPPSTWSWTADPSNPQPITIAGANSPVASFTAPKVAGRFRFRLEVDGSAAAADEVTVVVTSAVPENLSPAARAGSRQTVVQGAAIDLDGAASTDDGTIQAYEWAQVGGPDADLDPTGAATASGTAPLADAVLRFWLMVHDGRKYGPPDQVTVISGTQAAPVADAGTDRTGFVAQVLTLSSAGSLPAPGQTIDGRQWVQVSGKDWYDADLRDPNFDPAAASPQLVVPGDASSLTSTRVLLFALTVSDPTGTSVQDLVSVTFTGLPKNAQPVASASAPASIYRPGNQVVMTASAQDADGDPVSYFWEQISGPAVAFAPATLPQITVTAPAQSATLVFRVTANDGTGEPNATDTADVSFSVNRPPVLVVSSTPAAGPADTFVTLSGTGTADPDDATLSYAWTEIPPQEGGTVTLSGANTITATFTQPAYAVTGNGLAARRRTFRLTVTDSVGPSGATSATVTFSPNRAPVLNAIAPTGDRKIFYSNSGQTIDRSETLTANSSVVDTPTVDADGDTLTWSWRIVSAPFANPPSSYLSSTTSRTITFGAPKPTQSLNSTGGVYRLGVVGSDGAELSTEVTVDVLVTASFLGDIYPMFTSSCNNIGCHNSSASGGLRLDQGASQSRTNLVTVTGYAQPNNYSGSTLWNNLNNGTMPKSAAPFAPFQVNMVRDWIQPEHNVGSPEGLSSGAENN